MKQTIFRRTYPRTVILSVLLACSLTACNGFEDYTSSTAAGTTAISTDGVLRKFADVSFNNQEPRSEDYS